MARNRKGWGIPSQTFLIIAAKTPDAPVNVDFILDSEKIPVTWNEPPNMQGATLTGYKVEYSSGSQSY